MRTSAFGSAGPQVPVVGQGTWYFEQAPRVQAVAALQRGLDLGLTHIDTAEMYGSGAAETIVGEAIAGRRQAMFLVSKVLPSNASRRGTIAACERSLARLRTDYLDCYLLHWPGSYPLEDTIASFQDLVRAGKIRSWGVSNFDLEDLEEAARIAGPGVIACNQVLYHLKERAIEHRITPWCRQNGVAVVAYSPFGHDDFPSGRSAQGRVLGTIAAAHGATPRQVALAYLTREASVFAIPKAADTLHVAENAGAGKLALSADNLAQLDQAFPLAPPGLGLPML